MAPRLGVVGVDRRKIQHPIDQFSDEPAQMILGQPLVQTRRHQQDLIRLDARNVLSTGAFSRPGEATATTSNSSVSGTPEFSRTTDLSPGPQTEC